MGFASYLEDINSRLIRLEVIVNDYNKVNETKIDIDQYFRLRQEVLSVIEKVRPYIDRDIDLIDYIDLKNRNQGLQKQREVLEEQSQNLKKHNQILQDGINKVMTEITSLEKANSHVNRDLAEKSNQLKQITEESNLLKKRVHDRAREMLSLKLSERELSELLLDYASLFKKMEKIVKSNGWHKENSKLKELESLIQTGTRKQ